MSSIRVYACSQDYAGAIVPVPRGLMRNEWFPRRVADYVTVPELRALRIEEAAILRDFEFDSLDEATKPPADVSEDLKDASEQDTAANEMRVARDMELVASSVPERIEMFREPILEEKGKESARQKEDAFRGTGAASDLLALRRRQVQELRDDKANQKKTTAIYGSVTIQDVLTVIRGAMGEDEDAKSVALHEGDLKFVDLPQSEDSDTDRLKHLGDFTVEIKVKGAEDGVRKIVGVLPHSKKADQDGQAL